MEKPPFASTLSDTEGRLTRPWTTWFTSLWVQTNNDSGPTIERPTKDLFVGKQYYDTTLNKPIWLRSVRPTVWKDATGSSV